MTQKIKTERAEKRHAHMVDDELRTKPLVKAIRDSVKKDMVVIDIGTGTGILAIEAAKTGAKHVYALDCDKGAIACAKKLAKDNAVQEKISFINKLSFDFEPEEKADLIICETVGSFAFDENILATLLDAKKRMLKRGGKTIPQTLKLFAVPIERVPELDSLNDIAEISAADFAADPKMLNSIDFNDRFDDFSHAKASFKVKQDCTIRAIALWPEINWNDKHKTSASPLKTQTHWKQGIMPLEPKFFKKGELAKIEVVIEPHPESPILHTERLWRWDC